MQRAHVWARRIAPALKEASGLTRMALGFVDVDIDESERITLQLTELIGLLRKSWLYT